MFATESDAVRDAEFDAAPLFNDTARDALPEFADAACDASPATFAAEMDDAPAIAAPAEFEFVTAAVESSFVAAAPGIVREIAPVAASENDGNSISVKKHAINFFILWL